MTRTCARFSLTVAVEAVRMRLQPLFAGGWAWRWLHHPGEARLRRDLGLCATVVRISARRPDSSPDPSLRESHLSPHVSQSGVASHSPRQDARPQAGKPRRQAIPSLLPCDCRLRRATGGLRRRFARHLRLQTRPLQEERTGEAAGKAGAASEGQSRGESFAGRRAGRRAGSPRRFRAEAKNARPVHLGDGLSAGARERPRSGLLPAARRSPAPTVAQREESIAPLASATIFRLRHCAKQAKILAQN